MLNRLSKLAVSTLGVVLTGLALLATPTYADTATTKGGSGVEISQKTSPETPQTCGLAWRTMTNPATDSSQSYLWGIEAIADDNVWAVGERLDSEGQKYPLALHWDGTAWSTATIPPKGRGSLESISATAANDVWAVGYNLTDSGTQTTLILHYNGSTWSEVASPDPGIKSRLFEVFAVSSGAAYAVGHYYPDNDNDPFIKALVLRWNGAAWTIETAEEVGTYSTTLHSVSASSDGDVWAAGYYVGDNDYVMHPMIMRRQGNQWVQGAIGSAGNLKGELRGIAVAAPNLAWAVGRYIEDGASQTLALKWDGTSWSTSSSFSAEGQESFLVDVDTRQGGAWAVGYNEISDSEDYAVPVTLRFLNNSWVEVPTTQVGPTYTLHFGVSVLSVEDDVWAAGAYNANQDLDYTLVQRYSDPCAHQPDCNIQFSDVPEGSTFYPFVRCLACHGVLGGYGDGTFRPGNNVTRGQLAKIVANAADFNEQPGPAMFADVAPGSTYYDYVQRLAFRSIISGYPCGGAGEPCQQGNLKYFRPNANATRGQIAKIVSDAAGFSDAPGAAMFADVAADSPFFVWVQRLASRGVTSGYPCGSPGEPCGAGNLPYFRPNQNTTRGQIAKIVGNTFFPNCQP